MGRVILSTFAVPFAQPGVWNTHRSRVTRTETMGLLPPPPHQSPAVAAALESKGDAPPGISGPGGWRLYVPVPTQDETQKYLGTDRTGQEG